VSSWTDHLVPGFNHVWSDIEWEEIGLGISIFMSQLIKFEQGSEIYSVEPVE
jgi:hypothetical protein